MAKQRKKKNKSGRAKTKPPISSLDKFIYSVIFVIGALAIIALYYLWEILMGKIAFSDGSVIAFSSRNTYFYAIPFFVYLIVSLGVGAIVLFTIPLFKNKNVNYNDNKWIRVYPLFDKTQTRPKKREEDKKSNRKMFFCWLGGLLLTFLVLLLALCGRYTINVDFMVQKYTIFNNVSETYVSRDFESVEFVLNYSMGGRYSTRGYSLYADIKMKNGESVVFDDVGFKSDNMGDVFRFMLELKEVFPEENVTYYTNTTVEDAKEWWELSEDETELLKMLMKE